jgi:anti-sigma B factor antagonist
MLKVHVKNLERFTVLCLQGQIITGETDDLRTAVQSVSNARALILDFSRVTTIDAHGLGVLLDLRQRAQSKGMRFELMNVSKPMRRIFEITRLDSVFDITSSVEIFPRVSARPHATMTALKSCA